MLQAHHLPHLVQKLELGIGDNQLGTARTAALADSP